MTLHIPAYPMHHQYVLVQCTAAIRIQRHGLLPTKPFAERTVVAYRGPGRPSFLYIFLYIKRPSSFTLRSVCSLQTRRHFLSAAVVAADVSSSTVLSLTGPREAADWTLVFNYLAVIEFTALEFRARPKRHQFVYQLSGMCLTRGQD